MGVLSVKKRRANGADWRNLKACGRVLKEFVRPIRHSDHQLGATVKWQAPRRARSRPLKNHTLVFELKSFGRSPRKGALFKMNRNHSASEQDRRGNTDGDNG